MTSATPGDDQEEYACNCGEVFETLDELKAHAKRQHPDVYEETFAG